MADPIGEQAEERGGEDRREEHPTVGEARLLQRQAFDMLEVLDGVGGAKREEHGGVEHVQPKDVPIRTIESQHPGPIDTFPRATVIGPRARPLPAIQPVEQRGRREARHRDGGAEPQRRLPASLVQRVRPCRRGVHRIRADARKAQIQCRRERDAAAREPLRQCGHERNENRAFAAVSYTHLAS